MAIWGEQLGQVACPLGNLDLLVLGVGAAPKSSVTQEFRELRVPQVEPCSGLYLRDRAQHCVDQVAQRRVHQAQLDVLVADLCNSVQVDLLTDHSLEKVHFDFEVGE